MQTYYLDSSEKEGSFEKINTFLDTLKKEEPAQIYINSSGGACWFFFCLGDRLNRMVYEGYDIALRIIFIGSSAFQMAYTFKGKRILEKDAEGVVHIWATDWGSTHNSVVRTTDPVTLARKKYMDQQPQWEYPFLTEEEQKQFKDGADIWISPDRMAIIFNT